MIYFEAKLLQHSHADSISLPSEITDPLICVLIAFLELFDIYIDNTDRSLKSAIFIVTLSEADGY